MDISRNEALSQAEKLVLEGWTVYFKFTCQHCGARVCLRDANTLWSHGECCECGKTTELERVGFMVLR